MPKFVANPKKSLGRSGRIWEANRKACLQRSQLCWICAGECPDFRWKTIPFESTAIDMTLQWPDPASASVDHKIPISQLAKDSPLLYRQENLAPAHLKCNSARGDGKRDRTVVCRVSRNWLS